MQFCEICEHDSHRDTILNLSLRLRSAIHIEKNARDLLDSAIKDRMEIEKQLSEIVGIVIERNAVEFSNVNGVHSSDEGKFGDLK